MPMIDVYAASGTFADPKALARDLAATLMKIEGVPDIPMFRKNTAGFIHDLPPGALSKTPRCASSSMPSWGASRTVSSCTTTCCVPRDS